MELLRDKKLNNGVHLSFYNGSKQVAGDRWLVVLKIVSTKSLTDEMLKEIAKSDDSKFYLDKFNGNLSFEIERKKHFVDEKLVGIALEELMDQAESNMAEYFNRPDFVDKLFIKEIEKLRKQCLLEKQIKGNNSESNFIIEPEDFSSCFN